MTELIELRPVKARRSHKRSYTFATAQTLDDSSDDDDDDDSSSEEEASPIVFNLRQKPKKSTKRKNKIQTLPIIINQQSTKEKKRSPQKHIQQFLINAQPPASPKKEVILQPIMPPRPPSPTIQLISLSPPPAPVTTVIEREPYPYPYPYPYPPVYTPHLIEDHPFDFYRSYPSPIRRIGRRYPPHARSVHLPKHTRKVVNRFLNGMEYAHDYRVSRTLFPYKILFFFSRTVWRWK